MPRRAKIEITYDGTAAKAKAVKAVSSTSNSVSVNESGEVTYTVIKGDTLWAIAKRFLGEGSRYTEIYDANKDIIESTAKAHGKPNSDHGHWIWAGEVLVIPGTTSESNKKTYLSSGSTTTKSKLGNKIEKQLTSFSYTDEANGKSDSISLTMYDIGREWMGSLMPEKSAHIKAKINLDDWENADSLECGTFLIDDISFSGWPLSCNVSGVSAPTNDDFKSLPQSQTFEKTTIRQIASQFATKAKVSLVYDAPDIQIAEIEQKKKTNSAFLYDLCEKYGLAMKVYNNKIVIFDMVAYEAKKAVMTITDKMIESWSYNTTIEGTYTGVKLSYTDPKKKTINVTIGKDGRMYSLNTQASSRYDAELQAAAKINEANRGIETMSITVFPCTLVASQCVNVKGFGNIDGKYFIDQIKHSIGSGYKMQLTLHKVQAPFKP